MDGNDGEQFARDSLVRLKVDDINWTILWKDPKTGEHWKQFYPRSEMHGGGPPEFVVITESEAINEFGIS